MEGVKLFDESLVGGEMTREEWLESDGCKLTLTLTLTLTRALALALTRTRTRS